MQLTSSVARQALCTPRGALVRSSPAPGRLGPSRRTLVVPTAVDAASANDVLAAVGAFTAVALPALMGVAQVMREAELETAGATAGAGVSAGGQDSPQLINLAASGATTSVPEPFVAPSYKAAAQASAAAVQERPAAAGAAGQASAATVAGKTTVDARAAEALAGWPMSKPAAELAGKMSVDAAAAAQVASDSAVSVKQAQEAYEEKKSKILSDSTLAYQQAHRAQQEARTGGAGLGQRVAALSQGYQDKINSIKEDFTKRQLEAGARRQRGKTVSLDPAEVAEANRVGQNPNPLQALWQWIVALFRAIIAWLAGLFGGGSSGAGAAA